MIERYSKQEIKEKFQTCRDKKELLLDDDEYEIFCSAVRCLSKKNVDEIYDEIYFVSLNKKHPARYLNLASEDLNTKKAIILLSEWLFCLKIINDDEIRYFHILHEIAHHTLGHVDFKNPKERQNAEKEANRQARKWLIECEFFIPSQLE